MEWIRKVGSAWALALCVGLFALPAAADTEKLGGTGSARPWAEGVAPENQQKATELFRRGNDLLKDSIFVQAAAAYREALKLWDHPAIHYNLVLALLNLDQPVEVHQHLLSALKHGPAPLDLDKYEQAKAYKVLVEKQLVRLKVACEQEGAAVVLDGRPLFVGPGNWEGLVRPGPHSVVASKDGYLTSEISRELPAGETIELPITLKTAAQATEFRRKWANWIPWTVFGAGAAVALAGAGLHTQGIDQVRSFDQGIEDCGGCVPDAELEGLKTGGARLQQIAVGAYATGGAAVITGAVLLYINRLQPYIPDPSTGQLVPDESASLELTPVLGGDHGGLAASVRF